MSDRRADTDLAAREAMRLHPVYRGKIQIAAKVPVRGFDDFAIWYTPGVAAPCKAIAARPELVYEHTNKGNSIAIVTDGTRVLGLGDIGPEAGLPVMEGKALLFKYLGGVDAVPICLATKDADEIVRTVRLLEPAFGGINLEDIAQPKCFRVLDALRTTMGIPVWHDDQQGTATVVLAALTNALSLVHKDLSRVRIALVGAGAANVATYRILVAAGADPRAIVACDTKGTLHRGREDVASRAHELADKWKMCRDSNGAGVVGGIEDALRGADVCIAFSQSGPDVIAPQWIRAMAKDAIVFACANPVPEIWPWLAKEAGARIVATGRSDLPNQVNNSLGFPGIFRGVIEVRARAISDGMAIAAAKELASCARDEGLDFDRLLPPMDAIEVPVREAVVTAMTAQREGLARASRDAESVRASATKTIVAAREATALLFREGIVPAVPPLGT